MVDRLPRRLAGGTAAQVAAYTGPSRELIVNTEDKRLHLQDGVTPGGIRVPTPDDVATFIANFGFATPEHKKAVGDGIADDLGKINDALAAAGRGRPVYAYGIYYCPGDIIIPDEAALVGGHQNPAQSRPFNAAPGSPTATSPFDGHSLLILPPGASVRLGRGSTLSGFRILNAALRTKPDGQPRFPLLNEAEALELLPLFAGTAIIANEADAALRNLMVLGFDRLSTTQFGADGGRFLSENVRGDCNNGHQITGGFDVCKVLWNKMWAFLTAHAPGVLNDSLALARPGKALHWKGIAATNAGADWSGSLFTESYGYAEAMVWEDSSHVKAINAHADHIARANPPAGVKKGAFHVLGKSNDCELAFATVNGGQDGLVMDTEGRFGSDKFVVIGGDLRGDVHHKRGTLIFQGPKFSGLSPAIRREATAGRLIINGAVLTDSVLYSGPEDGKVTVNGVAYVNGGDARPQTASHNIRLETESPEFSLRDLNGTPDRRTVGQILDAGEYKLRLTNDALGAGADLLIAKIAAGSLSWDELRAMALLVAAAGLRSQGPLRLSGAPLAAPLLLTDTTAADANNQTVRVSHENGVLVVHALALGETAQLELLRIERSGLAALGVKMAGPLAVTGASLVTEVGAENGAVFRSANAGVAGPRLSAYGSRGTLTGPTITQSGDSLLDLFAFGHDGTKFVDAALLRVDVSSAAAVDRMPGRLRMYFRDAATGTLTERWRFETNGQLTHAPSGNGVISAAGHHKLRSYTIATLPSPNAAETIYVSDGAANKRLAVADGTNWRWPDGTIVS